MAYKKLLIAFAFLMLTVACATTENYDAQLNKWLGKSEKELVMGWGVPDKQYQLDANTKMLSYVRSDIVSYPGTLSGCVGGLGSPIGYAGCTGIPPTLESYYCETTFILVRHRVARWGHKGNNCTA